MVTAAASIIAALIGIAPQLFASHGPNSSRPAEGQVTASSANRVTSPSASLTPAVSLTTSTPSVSVPLSGPAGGPGPGAGTAPPWQGFNVLPGGAGPGTVTPGAGVVRPTAPHSAAALPASGGGHARWSGTLVLGPLGGGEKDLDARPPVRAGSESDNDLYITVSSPATVYGLGSVNVARGPGSGTPATSADCANAVASGTSDGVPLARGTVVCAITGEGRVVRLTVTATPTDARESATFDTVVWDAP
jgi:hypothetical protein